MEAIIGALIAGAFSLIGVIITNLSGNKKIVNDIRMENTKATNDIKLELTSYKAETNEKITELTREVREHNNFAKRMPVVENEIKHIEEKISTFHKGE